MNAMMAVILGNAGVLFMLIYMDMILNAEPTPNVTGKSCMFMIYKKRM